MTCDPFDTVKHYVDRKDHCSAEASAAIREALASIAAALERAERERDTHCTTCDRSYDPDQRGPGICPYCNGVYRDLAAAEARVVELEELLASLKVCRP